MVRNILTQDEIYSWMSYFKFKEPDVPEIQMAILISSVRNALGGKSKPKDFMISNTKQTATKKRMGMSSSAVAGAFKGISKKMK